MTTSPEVCWHLNTHLSILSGRCFPGVTGSLCVSCSGITVARINNTPHVLDVRRQAPGMQRPYYGMWVVQSGSVKKNQNIAAWFFKQGRKQQGCSVNRGQVWVWSCVIREVKQLVCKWKWNYLKVSYLLCHLPLKGNYCLCFAVIISDQI